MSRPKKPTVSLPDFVHRVSAKGRIYYYFQPQRGTKGEVERVRLPDLSDSEFWPRYKELARPWVGALPENAFAAIIGAYKASPEFRQLADSTRRAYTRYLGVIEEAWGPLDIAGLHSPAIIELRDRFADTPRTANYVVATVSALMTWAKSRGRGAVGNPCEDVPALRTNTEGYRPWPLELIQKFEAGAPSREIWWPVALALYTGQRQADVLSMPWTAITDNVIYVSQQKLKGHKFKGEVWVPVHRTLQEILTTIPKRAKTILTNTRGQPWTGDGFRTSFGRATAQLEIPEGFVFHGLRKSAVVMLLEAGAKVPEVAAITGQTWQMVEHYAQQVNQKKLAASAILKWEAEDARRLKAKRVKATA